MKSFASLLSVTLLAACRSPETRPPDRAETPETYSTLEERMVIKLGFFSPGLAHASYQPLADYLTPRTPYRFDIRLARTPDDAMAFLEERIADVVELDPLSYLDVHDKFGAVPLARPLGEAGEPLMRCVLVTRPESALRRISDLKGKKLGLGPRDSLMTYLLPRDELSKERVATEDLQVETVADEQTVIASVVSGRLDAGAVTQQAAARSKDDLRVFHVSAPLPTGPLTVRPDLPDGVTRLLSEAFLSLRLADASRRREWNPVVQNGFAPACDADYDPVRKLLRRVAPLVGDSRGAPSASAARTH